MNNLPIPLSMPVFFGLFAFAMVREGRKQREAKNKLFKDLASKHGLKYLAEDDGQAQAFAEDFDGVGRFSSSSLNRVIPKNAVIGSVKGGQAIVFRPEIQVRQNRIIAYPARRDFVLDDEEGLDDLFGFVRGVALL